MVTWKINHKWYPCVASARQGYHYLTMKKRLIFAIAVFSFCVLCAGEASSQDLLLVKGNKTKRIRPGTSILLTLSNGTFLQGKVDSYSKDTLLIQTPSGPVYVGISNVKSLRKSRGPIPAFAVPLLMSGSIPLAIRNVSGFGPKLAISFGVGAIIGGTYYLVRPKRYSVDTGWSIQIVD